MDQVIEYDLPAAAIADMEKRYMPLVIKDLGDEEGFKLVHDARMDVKNHRVAVEKKRVALKADALTWGRKVDTEAKRIFGLLEPIETHLKTEEAKITEEKKRIEAEEKRQEEIKIQWRVDEMAKYGVTLPYMEVATMSDLEFSDAMQTVMLNYKVEQDRLAAEKKAEDERLEKERLEREAEEKRLAEEREKQEAIAKEQSEVAAKLKADLEKVEAEKRALAEEKREAEEAKRLESAKKEAAEKALKEQAQAEIRAKAERDREEALKPDRDKITTYADKLYAVPMPDVDTDEAEGLLNEFLYKLEDLTKWLKNQAQSL